MKLHEVLHLFRLPSPLRKSVLAYSLKKVLGGKITNEERGANQALRVLAVVDGSLEIVDHEYHWKIQVDMERVHVITRNYPSSDLGILFQVLGKKDYTPVIDIVKSLGLKSPMRVVDAGANVGFASLFFSAAFPSCEIISLEIDNSNLAQMKANLALNKKANVTVVPQALWKKSADLVIKRDFRDRSECSYYVEEVATGGNIIGHDLSHFLNLKDWDSVDLLKIDIEGAERYLFETDAQADTLLSKTKVLAIEIHDEYNCREKIYSDLKRNHFTFFESGDLTIAHRTN